MDKRKESSKKETMITIYRDKGGQKIPYHVIDTIPQKEPFDWERVVAVFTQGATWQFKSWTAPWNNPVSVFSKVPGFYVHFEDEKIPDLVKAWDVRLLILSKISTKKHLITTACTLFWDTIDSYCSLKKVTFSY